MDLSTIGNINNPDEETRNNAIKVIQEAQNDPSFVNFLLNIMQSPDVQKDKVIFEKVLIVLVDTARNHSSNFIDATDSAEVKQKLIELLFSIPQVFRPHIEECLISLAPSAPVEFSGIFQTIFETVNPESSIDDIYTAISFANKWTSNSKTAPFFQQNFIEIIFPYLQACTAEKEMTEVKANTISELAELAETLISKGNIIFNSSFDSAIQILCHLITQQLETKSGLKMKSSIFKLLFQIIYSVYERWKAIPDLNEWRQGFIENIVPGIFQSSLQASQQKMDQNLVHNLFHLFYIFITFGINYEQILTPEFFKEFLIPAARLSSDDINDYSLNPLQYITFCCEHEDVGFFSPRICASQFLKVVMTQYQSFIDPLPLILQQEEPNPEDQLSLLDFEARLYLLERYTITAYTNETVEGEENEEKECHAELPPDVFETYFNLLTQEQPLYIVSALLRFVTIPMSKGDNAVVAISVAEHFIINSVDPIVQTMAVRLMNSCFTSFGDDKLEQLNGIIEINTPELFPALLNLSSSLHIPEPAILIQKIFKIGPSDYTSIVEELVHHLFTLWRENETAINGSNEENEDAGDEEVEGNIDETNQLFVSSTLLESLTTVLESLPYDSPIIQSLSVQVIQQLAQDITDFPDNKSISDQIRVAAVFSRKLSTPNEDLISFISLIIQMSLDPPTIVDSFVLLICPLMFNDHFDFCKLEFQEYLINFCQSLLKFEGDPEYDSISQSLVLASCMIQSKGEDFFPFVTSASQFLLTVGESKKSIESLKKKPIMIFGVVYVLASALFKDAEKAQVLLIAEIIELISEVAPTCCLKAAYREIKMTVTVLTWFAKFGHQKSFNAAASLFKPLLDMKEMDESLKLTKDNLMDRANLHREQELVSLSPLLQLPFDDFDELKFFMDFSSENGLIGSLPDEIGELLSKSTAH